MNVKMNLPKEVQYIISKLLSAGYTAHVVGGAVRDFLLGCTPGDYDITTSATPEEIKAVFAADKTVDTGLQHGTVSVILNHCAYEVTTYRIDGEYLDARHPNSVSFTRDIREDLSRRDFTVNAMAYSDADGIVDLFSGEEDLKRGVIRAVGSPEKRFSEDALRILRALRFASRLGFTIEEETSRAIFKCAPLLLKVARERIYTEWCKLLAGVGAYEIIEKYASVIRIFIPELDSFSLPAKEKFQAASPTLRFAALFCDKGSDAWCGALDGLHADNKTKLLGKALIDNISRELSSSYKIKCALFSLGEETLAELIAFRHLLGNGDEGESEALSKILKAGECFRLSDLKITGKELIALGSRGKMTGEILLLLLDSVMKGELENESTALTSRAIKLISNA